MPEDYVIKWDKEYKTKRQVQIEYRYYTTSGKTHKTMEVWKKYKFGDVVQFNPTERMQKGTIAKKISMEKLLSNSRSIAGYEFENFMGGTKFRNGDTLMARITPCLENGKIAYVSLLDKNEVGFGSTEFIVFRAIEGITDAKFVYYFVSNPWFRDIAIKSMVGSSGRQRVQQGVLKNLEIILPPLSEQKRIAGILSALDDKIELNRRINANLEIQAMTLYKQWFVDGRQENWEYMMLGDVAIVMAGGDRPTICSKTETEETRVPIYSNGIDNEGLYGYTNVAIVNEPSVTISARGTIGYVCLRQKPYTPIVRLISAIPEREYISAVYLYLWAKNMNIMGTGTTQQQLTVPDFKKQKVLIPDSATMQLFNDVAEPIFELIDAYKQENNTIAYTRDTLLPKLINNIN